MDIRSLEVFLALSEALHFGRAAERLSMSQSSVSEHVRRLEARLGRNLFDRTSRRVTMTATGEILAHRLRDPIKAIRLALREAERGGRTTVETLRVGFLGGGFYELYEPLVQAHKLDHPGVALEFVELNYDTQFSAILQGEVDIAFCRLPVGLDGLEAGPIVMSDPRVVCVNVAHRLAGRDYIDAEELRGETMLRVPASQAGTKWSEYHFPLATPQRYPLAPGPMIRTVREGIAAVVAGHGVFFLTKRAAHYYATPRMTFVEVNLPPIQSALVWRRGDARGSIAAFNRILMRVAREAKIA
ncbi:LysR family transcriptional regulator [Beijerinckia indica]|uniref:Transcriptional regulator, LysR family n=1 Tax=Beijerinckia indica subsp. indica (strain ATCC 9039 / DSM 1715 / NCIMB 8712) TaxID=395963 RepID=B2IL05_BEII9|nr:LysR family transcriptional regulator [Beijerinckia indica]ACB96545.1 transcriptional regulator, LysR family [Beijerinckia indica subsp. indica ATCC 9039]